MANLTPERRVDKNGKAVTRHVRASGPSGGGRSFPAPKLDARADSTVAPFGVKPRPKQLERGHLGMFPPNLRSPSEELWDSPDEGKLAMSHRLAYGAEVTIVEFFDVASAVRKPIDALKLVSKGVRSGQQARELLAARGAEHLGADMTGAARRALEANVHPYDFITWFQRFDGDDRRPEDVMDAVRLSATSLWEDDHFDACGTAIAEGRIRFDDVKAVGITTLKPNKRLKRMHAVLERLASGEADGDAVMLKGILQKATAAAFDDHTNYFLGRLLAAAGITRVTEAESLDTLVTAFKAFTSGLGRPKPWTDEEAAELALYHESLGDAVVTNGPEVYRSAEFFQAGIPADVARQVLASGGTAEAAQGILDHDISRAVSDGWL